MAPGRRFCIRDGIAGALSQRSGWPATLNPLRYGNFDDSVIFDDLG